MIANICFDKRSTKF
jgi:hypothetical protein